MRTCNVHTRVEDVRTHGFLASLMQRAATSRHGRSTLRRAALPILACGEESGVIIDYNFAPIFEK